MKFLDNRILEWFTSIRRPWLTSAMIDISALGGPTVLTLVVLIAVGLLLSLRRRRSAGFVLVAAVGGAMLARAVKVWVGRARPVDLEPVLVLSDPFRSFPSGHSMLSAVIYLTIALIATAVIPRWRVRVYVVITSLILVGLIGLSRLYLHAHYLTDVIGGWAGGLAWALICRWVEFRWVLRAERKAAAAEESRSPVPI